MLRKIILVEGGCRGKSDWGEGDVEENHMRGGWSYFTLSGASRFTNVRRLSRFTILSTLEPYFRPI